VIPFTRPEALWLVALVPLIGWFVVTVERRRRAALRAFAGVADSRLEDAAPPRFGARRVALACALLVLAIAGPRIGVEEREVTALSIDVAIAVDASRSMWSSDVGEPRIDRARREVATLVRGLEGARISLHSFAGASRRLSPLTRDHAGLIAMLDEVDPAFERIGGSSLAAALAAALEELGDESPRRRAVILVTDGEDLGDAAELAALAARARTRGIEVHGVLVGTRAGGPVPAAADRREFVREGPAARISHADPRALAGLAATTSGLMGQLAEEPFFTARLLAERFGEGARRRDGRDVVRRPHDRYRWLVAAAFFVLFWPRRVRAPRRESRPSPLRAFAIAPLLLLAGDAHEEFRKAYELHGEGRLALAIERYRAAIALDPEDPRSRHDLAIALLEIGDFAAARAEFAVVASLARDPAARAAARYGEGLALGRVAEAAGGGAAVDSWTAARQRFLEAALAGYGEDAATSLDHATRMLDRESPPPSGQEPGDGDGAPRDPDEGDGPTASSQAGSEPQASDEPDARRGDAQRGGEPGEGAEAEGVPPPPPPPPDVASELRGRSLREIVAEYERRRIAYDRSVAERSRSRVERDW
jgi:Ca-activated chloride channel family protein